MLVPVAVGVERGGAVAVDAVGRAGAGADADERAVVFVHAGVGAGVSTCAVSDGAFGVVAWCLVPGSSC
jgi:hypothetical protein